MSDMLYKFCDVDGLIAVDRNGVKRNKESNTILISGIFFEGEGAGWKIVKNNLQLKKSQ